MRTIDGRPGVHGGGYSPRVRSGRYLAYTQDGPCQAKKCLNGPREGKGRPTPSKGLNSGEDVTLRRSADRDRSSQYSRQPQPCRGPHYTAAGVVQRNEDGGSVGAGRLLILNGRIVDGTGNPWFYGDVAIRGDRIVGVAATGAFDRAIADELVDARGLVVCPGFIDIQSHSIVPFLT